ncbi:hypothetical protein F2Q69_00025189 [Brassica cretica]|uniref:Uncharacterized protein n=1 Tax=Brassica cretica TaxID=69181 RepID=A0A8S9QDY8_BRACR|nr:hypothetical protein F2Q69_00025189 [Brassica cretica]
MSVEESVFHEIGSLDVGRNLSSRRTETDFGKGKFRLHLGLDGNLQLLVLNSNSLSDSDVYFHYYESRTKEPNPGTRLVFNRSGYMYVLLSSKQQLSMLTLNKEAPVSSTDFYHRAVLHFDDVGRNLSSRRTETDFGKGKFRLHLGLDGNLQLLVLNSNSLSDSDVYFHYYESRTKEPNPGTRLVFNRSGYMYVLLNSKQQLNAYSQQGSSRVFYRLLPPCRSTFRRCFN